MSEVKLDTLTPDTQDGAVPVVKPKKKKKIGKIIRVIIIILVVLVAAAAVYRWRNNRRQPVQTGAGYYDHTVGTRDITLNLSGTGSLNPADSYTVTTLISGEILSAPFEEGDIVDKDTMLYQVDSADVATSIEQAQNSLAQTRRSYEQKLKNLEDLNVKAPEGGMIIELLVEPGDKVTAGQTVAAIRDSATMKLVVPFGTDDAGSFHVGQAAEVTLDSTFEQLSGTVSKIAAIETRLEGNMLVKMVTIDVKNPGGISSDQAATAKVGDISCNGSGTFSYKSEATVTAAASGEVSEIHIEEGDTVAKNQVIVTLTSDTMQNDILNSESSLRDSELSLENRYSQLDNYTISSPISGTIIEKHYKEGDTLEGGKALCTIFDLSYLSMTLNIDELDIAKIEVGQPVIVTAEALPGRFYNGTVTKVNINGSTANGVTSYPVTIRIDETDGLLPGMNVQASITVSESKGTIAIPVSALSRGNRVLVKAGGSQTPPQSDQNAAGSQRPEGFTPPEGGQMPEGFTPPEGGQVAPGSQRPEGFTPPEGGQSFSFSESGQGGFTMQGAGQNTLTLDASGIPEGFTYVEVTPGISDGDYIEILDGLNPGDIIAVPETVIPMSQGFFGMMPAGGGPGGGATRTGGGGYSQSTVVVRG